MYLWISPIDSHLLHTFDSIEENSQVVWLSVHMFECVCIECVTALKWRQQVIIPLVLINSNSTWNVCLWWSKQSPEHLINVMKPLRILGRDSWTLSSAQYFPQEICMHSSAEIYVHRNTSICFATCGNECTRNK